MRVFLGGLMEQARGTLNMDGTIPCAAVLVYV